MKTTLILIGKTDGKLYQAAIDDYAGRISHYMPFSIKVIPDIKNSRSLSEDQQKEREGELILANVSAQDCLVLLDERGEGGEASTSPSGSASGKPLGATSCW